MCPFKVIRFVFLQLRCSSKYSIVFLIKQNKTFLPCILQFLTRASLLFFSYSIRQLSKHTYAVWYSPLCFIFTSSFEPITAAVLSLPLTHTHAQTPAATFIMLLWPIYHGPLSPHGSPRHRHGVSKHLLEFRAVVGFLMFYSEPLAVHNSPQRGRRGRMCAYREWCVLKLQVQKV